MTKILIEVRGGSVVLVAADEPCHVTLRDWDNIRAGDADPLAEFVGTDDPMPTDYARAGYTLEVF